MGRKKILNLSIGVAALGAACITGIGTSGSASAASYAAKYIGASIGGNWVRLSSDGDVTMELIPSNDGSMAVVRDNVNVETNADSGYRLYVSGYNSEPDGYTALYYNGSPTNSDKLLSIHSTTPASFTTPNQWGFATVGEGYAEQSKYETAIGSGSIMDETTINSLKWKGIKSDYQLLTSTSTANTGNPHQVPVYYGVYANNDATLGDYRNIVVYTAFTESSNTITVDPGVVTNNGTMTITTAFQNPDSTSISADHIELTLYDSSNPSANIGTCNDIVVDSTNNGSNGNHLKFTCTYHAGSDAEYGKYYSVQLRIAPLDNGIYISYGNKDNAFGYGLSFADTTANLNTWCKTLPEWQPGDGENNTYEIWDTRGTAKSYMVRKLADGNCWMVQNLALENGSIGSYTLPSSDCSGGFNDNESTPGYMCYKGHANNTYNSTTKSYDSATNPGAYYSFNAATAATSNLTSGTATTSICPTGWKLPTKEQFNTLYTDNSKGYGNNRANFMEAFATLDSSAQGYYDDKLFYTNFSSWWSASVSSSVSGYRFYYDSNNVFTQNNTNSLKKSGYPIRCMLEPRVYMQDVGTTQEEAKSWCQGLDKWDSANSDATTYTLYDKRDAKGYLIRRLADGNCWMVQNLALEGGKTIYPSDSNITSTSYKLPDSKTSGWSSDTGQYMWNGTKHLDATQNNTPTTGNTTSPDNTGAYYSFLVATAGTGTGSTKGETASSSICPKWWHLPTAGSSSDTTKEFNILKSKYGAGNNGFNAAFRTPSTAFTGSCTSSYCPVADGYADFWSASIGGSTFGYYYYTSGSSTGSSSVDKRDGYSVRCMLTGGL